LARFEAFSDELVKISASEGVEKREKTKRWIKNALIMAGGAGVGSGLATGVDMLAGKHLGPKFQALSATTKRGIIGPLLGLVTTGAMLGGRKLSEEAQKREH
jgi:hypothetical protein